MNREIVSELSDGRLCITLHKEFYQPEAIRSAAYRFTDVCHVLVQASGDKDVAIVFETKANQAVDLNVVIREFANEVLDQQVRLDLERRYGEIRKLIVKQAFAPVASLEPEIGNDV